MQYIRVKRRKHLIDWWKTTLKKKPCYYQYHRVSPRECTAHLSPTLRVFLWTGWPAVKTPSSRTVTPEARPVTVFTSAAPPWAPARPLFLRLFLLSRETTDTQADTQRGRRWIDPRERVCRCFYLTWRSARPCHSDAEVWTFAPVSSGPVPGRVALWTPRPTWSSRSRGGRPTAVRRWWPSCWAVGRRERGRLKPRYSWWQSERRKPAALDRRGCRCGRAACAAETVVGLGARNGARSLRGREKEEGGGASGSRTPEPRPGACLAPHPLHLLTDWFTAGRVVSSALQLVSA